MDFDREMELENAGIDAFEFSLMDEDERREALEDAFLDPDDYDLIEYDTSFNAWSNLQNAGLSLSELEYMDEDEKRETLRDAGLDPDDYGDISTLSFYHPHHLSSYGGGAVVTLNQDDYVIADSITHWGRSCKCHIDKSLCTVPAGPAHNFTYERLGLNVEMSELNACFGRWQLQNIKQIEMARTRNYDSFYEALKDVPSLKVWPIPDVNCSPFVFPIRLKNGMSVRDAYAVLAEKGIEIRTLMGGAINEQEAFHNMLAGTEVPVAKEMADTTFFVGVHHTLPTEDVETVAQIISRM